MGSPSMANGDAAGHPSPNPIVAESLTWLGTPYHHGARVKGAGADCGQFPAAVYEACGLVPPIDPGGYPHDWHLHRDDERYLGIVERHFDKVRKLPVASFQLSECAGGASIAAAQGVADRFGIPEPGDLALFRYGRAVSHGSIVVAWPTIIHAYITAGAVVLDDAVANTDLAGRLEGFWRLK